MRRDKGHCVEETLKKDIKKVDVNCSLSIRNRSRNCDEIGFSLTEERLNLKQ